MIQIAIPMSGPALYLDDSDRVKYPKPLIEIGDKTMLEHVVGYLSEIEAAKKFLFIVHENEVRKHHIDNVISLVAGKDAAIRKHSGETRGAACTLLLAIDDMKLDDPLIICNCDQVISGGINESLTFFQANEADGGVICFDSVHPKWSFASTEDDGKTVNELAEKRPISRNAIAGFYYFRRAGDFVAAAQQSILKSASIDGAFYIAPTLNEFILKGKRVLMHKMASRNYHPLYSRKYIEAFENYLEHKMLDAKS